MERKATVIWQGDLKSGNGTITTESKALSGVPYAYGTRFEDIKGTNPEELIAAALASCFSMALSAELSKIKLVADSIDTQASVALEKTSAGWNITQAHLNVSAKIPGVSENQFLAAAQMAKKSCPVSKLIKSEITLEAYLSNSVVQPIQEAG